MGRPSADPLFSVEELLACLPSTVAAVADRTGLHRDHVYDRLRRLETNGAVADDNGTRPHVWSRLMRPPRPPTPNAAQVDAWLTDHRGGES